MRVSHLTHSVFDRLLKKVAILFGDVPINRTICVLQAPLQKASPVHAAHFLIYNGDSNSNKHHKAFLS